ncbi:MAG: NAD(+) diphosphatase [Rhizobiales bacterium]|nr:NAD(+) diphosphatase [Hyphomicrobiales bacterium]
MNDFDWLPLQEADAPKTLGFVHGTHDRAAHLRYHPDQIAEFQAGNSARFLTFCGESAVLARQGETLEAWFRAGDVPARFDPADAVFLGFCDQQPAFAVALDASLEESLKADAALSVVGVRQAALERQVSAEVLGAMAQGKAMTAWHLRHRFCANCGSPTVSAQGGWRRDCKACEAQHFPRTDPVVIMLIVHEDRCVLGRQQRFVPNVYSTLAGFVEPGETIEAAVRRETFEEAGIRTGRVRLVANQPWPFPMSLMIGAFAEATSFDITIDTDELEDCRWFSRDEVLSMIEKRHPAGLMIPPRMAIANHLIRLFAGLKD